MTTTDAAPANVTTFGRLADLPDWHLLTLRRVPGAGTPESDALVDCASQSDLSDHDLDCAVVHDRMLTRRLRLDAEEAAPMTTTTDAPTITLVQVGAFHADGETIGDDQLRLTGDQALVVGEPLPAEFLTRVIEWAEGLGTDGDFLVSVHGDAATFTNGYLARWERGLRIHDYLSNLRRRLDEPGL